MLAQRETFTTSRLLDFFSRKELTAQMGHGVPDWPLVAAKELIDNAMDACEEVGIAPEITVSLDDSGIAVADNGPGLPSETVRGILDFTVRVSSREAYVSPTRGAQGNALKTLVAMPFVLDGEAGMIEIEARGIGHRIEYRVDRIQQTPVIHHEEAPSRVKNGTLFTLHWPNSASSLLRESGSRFLQLLRGFVFINPHLTLQVSLWGEPLEWKATDPHWKKWRPSDPTSPHWYTPEHLTRLMSAYLALDASKGTEARPVRGFLAQFRGLTSTGKQKAVLEALGLSRQPLSVLVQDGQLNPAQVEALLKAMQAHSAPLKPQALGVIGKAHLEARFNALGCERASFKYDKQAGERNGVPYVVEAAFAWKGENAAGREIVTGINWSPGILNPFRQLGKLGESLDSVLQERRAGHNEPIILLLHLACARVSYADRGKSSVNLEGE